MISNFGFETVTMGALGGADVARACPTVPDPSPGKTVTASGCGHQPMITSSISIPAQFQLLLPFRHNNTDSSTVEPDDAILQHELPIPNR